MTSECIRSPYKGQCVGIGMPSEPCKRPPKPGINYDNVLERVMHAWVSAGPGEPKPGINYDNVLEGLKVSRYIQVIMPLEDRRDWIKKYIDASIIDDLCNTEGAWEVAEQFSNWVYEVYKQEKPEQIIITDLSQIRQVLMVWAADSVRR